MPNNRSTASASVALQAKARGAVSVQSAPSFSICARRAHLDAFAREQSRQ